MAGTSRRASSSSSRPVVEERGPSSKVRATTGMSVSSGSTSTWAGAEAGEAVSGTEAGTASIKHTTNKTQLTQGAPLSRTHSTPAHRSFPFVSM